MSTYSISILDGHIVSVSNLPVVLRFFLLLLETRIKMATMTIMMRIMPAMAIPIAKLLCEIQNLSGSYSRV